MKPAYRSITKISALRGVYKGIFQMVTSRKRHKKLQDRVGLRNRTTPQLCFPRIILLIIPKEKDHKTMATAGPS